MREDDARRDRRSLRPLDWKSAAWRLAWAVSGTDKASNTAASKMEHKGPNAKK